MSPNGVLEEGEPPESDASPNDSPLQDQAGLGDIKA
jgi:hypothetical protein